MFSPQRQTLTYIVRIWAEYLVEQPPSWRGEVELVSSGRKLHFSRLNELIEIIQQHCQPFTTEDPP